MSIRGTPKTTWTVEGYFTKSKNVHEGGEMAVKNFKNLSTWFMDSLLKKISRAGAGVVPCPPIGISIVPIFQKTRLLSLE